MDMSQSKKLSLTLLIVIALPVCAFSAPSISSISGKISHGENLVIKGSSFSTKPAAAPVVWDDCSGTDPYAKWDGNYNSGSGASYAGNYRTPAQVGRGVATAHARATKYFCGAHYPGTTAQNGRNVGVWKVRQITSMPSYTYLSYYHRADPGWNWNIDSTDDNYKEYCWGESNWPYTGKYWYNELYYRSSYHLLGTPISGNSFYGDPHWSVTSKWAKVEMEVRWDSTSSGYVKVWEDGVLRLNYSGPTNSGTGMRTELIGGYVRDSGATSQWRYWNDIYLDYSRARVLIGNASTYNASKIREVQIPTTWADGTITIKVNQGAFSNGQAAYLYIVDTNGNVNSNGFPLTFGQGQIIGSDTTPPATPSGLNVKVQ